MFQCFTTASKQRKHVQRRPVPVKTSANHKADDTPTAALKESQHDNETVSAPSYGGRLHRPRL